MPTVSSVHSSRCLILDAWGGCRLLARGRSRASSCGWASVTQNHMGRLHGWRHASRGTATSGGKPWRRRRCVWQRQRQRVLSPRRQESRTGDHVEVSRMGSTEDQGRRQRSVKRLKICRWSQRGQAAAQGCCRWSWRWRCRDVLLKVDWVGGIAKARQPGRCPADAHASCYAREWMLVRRPLPLLLLRLLRWRWAVAWRGCNATCN